MSSMLLTGVGKGGGPTLLAIGDYWYDGNAISAGLTPYQGQGWILTTKGTDGSAGDQTTREDSTGGVISWLKVRASSSFSTITPTARYQGGVTDDYAAWDGSAFNALSDLNETAWFANAVVSFTTRIAEFVPVTTTAVLIVLQATSIGISDMRE